MRWIWIDKFLEFRSGEFARAVKNVTLAEEHLHDHFPGYPVMPASLIIEGLAQAGGILVGILQALGSLSTFESVKGAQFVSVFLVLLLVLLVRPQGLFVGRSA